MKALTLLCKEMQSVINRLFSFSVHNLHKLSNPQELLHWGWIIYRYWAGVSPSGISAAAGGTNRDFLESVGEFSYTPTQSITPRQEEMCPRTVSPAAPSLMAFKSPAGSSSSPSASDTSP